MSDLDLTEDDVREEHLRGVSQPAHWAYLLGSLVLGAVAMLLLIAFLGATGG